jgi:quercetin dioxygenase-like cupin family protein
MYQMICRIVYLSTITAQVSLAPPAFHSHGERIVNRQNLFQRTVGTLAVAAALAYGVSAAAQGLPVSAFGEILSENLKWQPFPAFPPEARLAVLVGDPGKAGPYVVRVKLPAGIKLMPHTHPEDRIYTVISGVFYIGLGTVFDANKLKAYAPGSVIVLPANTPHFHWAKSGEAVHVLQTI